MALLILKAPRYHRRARELHWKNISMSPVQAGGTHATDKTTSTYPGYDPLDSDFGTRSLQTAEGTSIDMITNYGTRLLKIDQQRLSSRCLRV